MAYLPTQPAAELATKADISDLRTDVSDLGSHLAGGIDRLAGEVRHLSQRMDRLQTTLLGGFAAIVAGLIAAGFIN